MSSLFVATPAFTGSGHTIIGKNSDREPNEGQAIVRIPAMEQPDTEVMCTYIAIPQVKRTEEVLLARPYGQWGAEMGMNAHGVTVACNPVLTRFKPAKAQQGLTGLDLTRLALERCTSAVAARDLIITLLTEYGQHVPCGYELPAYSPHFGYLIADAQEAWLLETVDREWAARQVTGFMALADHYALTDDFDLHSEGLEALARQHKWVKKKKPFQFNTAFAHKEVLSKMKSKQRLALMEQFAQEYEGKFDAPAAITLLQMHDRPEEHFNPSSASPKAVCQYAHRNHFLQTNNAMVAEVRPEGFHIGWFTGTSAPSLSLFKPFMLPGKNHYEGIVKEPGKLVNDSLWWQAEVFHREVAANYQMAKSTFAAERDEIQQNLLANTAALLGNDANLEMLNQLTEDSYRMHHKKLMEWRYHLKKNPVPQKQFSPVHNRFLKQLTKKVMPIA